MATVSSRFQKERLKRAVGFEPTMIGFADQRLCPLGYARGKDSRFEIESFSDLNLEP